MDAARAVAVLGMIVVNVGPRTGQGFADVVHRLPLGRASLLFVLLAGLGITLLTRRTRAPGSRIPWPALLWRTGVLLLGGLALQLLDHEVSVILPTYAVLFLLAVPLLRAPDRVLLTGALTAGVLGPVAWIGLQMAQGTTYDPRPTTLLDSPPEIVHSILFSSPYPVITWLGPFLFGMWLARQDLRDRSVQRRMIVAGALATLAGRALSLALISWVGEPGDAIGFDRLVTSVAHSQMPLWLVSGTGSAVLVLGVLLRGDAFVRRRLRVLVATGQLALTIYVGHLLVLAMLVRPEPHVLSEGVLISLAIATGAVLFATAWTARFPRGPLEQLLRRPWARGSPPAKPRTLPPGSGAEPPVRVNLRRPPARPTT
ncbi:DUF418 domain-containing protein [Occultella aeris]|uniref:Acyltransferase family protein n=1 Tax=Occultella aeris TaxID=2761496 RepID=A0A7M4DKQ3_9MICO|nr:DUF418 domain-containing protein [Occultella aeris]VZO37744.1 Acyltransferase family protein [Occultella aeris]